MSTKIKRYAPMRPEQIGDWRGAISGPRELHIVCDERHLVVKIADQHTTVRFSVTRDEAAELAQIFATASREMTAVATTSV